MSSGRDKITKLILDKAAKIMPEYGIELVDVRFKRINYVETVQEKVFERMISERKRIAERNRSEGQGRAPRSAARRSATFSEPRPTATRRPGGQGDRGREGDRHLRAGLRPRSRALPVREVDGSLEQQPRREDVAHPVHELGAVEVPQERWEQPDPVRPRVVPLVPRPADRPAFSIVVVARNEARTLPHLLGSLWPFRERQGDLLLVDTGSEDETAELGRDFGCRVIAVGERFASRLTDAQAARISRRFAREGEGPLATAGQRLFHFARARQWASARVRHDVLWHLDGSDVVEVFDLDFVDGSIRRGEAGSVGCEVRLGTLSFRTCRFYDRRFDLWEGRVHEGLYPKSRVSATVVRAPRLECPPDRLAVRHVRRGQKERNYLAGLALEALPRTARPRWLHYLGRELHYLGFHRSAVAVLEEHAAREDAWRPERSGSLCFAGQSRLALGEPDHAADLFWRAFTIDSSWREPLSGSRKSARSRRVAVPWRGDGRARYQGRRRMSRRTKTTPGPRISRFYRSLLRLGSREEAREHWHACSPVGRGPPAFREDASAFEP